MTGPTAATSCLGRHGGSDTDKFTWLQAVGCGCSPPRVRAPARSHLADRARWLDVAHHGAKTLERPKDGRGRLFFSTSRAGQLQHYQRKPYGLVFYTQACLEHWRALGAAERLGLDVSDEVAAAARRRQTFLDRAEGPSTWCPRGCAIPALRPPRAGGVRARRGPRWALPGRRTALANGMCGRRLRSSLRRACGRPRGGRRALAAARSWRPRRQAASAHLCRVGRPRRRPGGLGSPGRPGAPRNPAPICQFPRRTASSAPATRWRSDGSSSNASTRFRTSETRSGSDRRRWRPSKGRWSSAGTGPGRRPRYFVDLEGLPLLDATVTAEAKLWWPHTEAILR